MFTRVMKARQINVDVSVLFADLRGYTTLSQSHPAATVSSLLDVFYDECAEAIWEYDGLLNKTVGDAIMAIFNFPIRHDDHAQRAVRAARDIQHRCRHLGRELDFPRGAEVDGSELGVGIGIDSGQTSFGEFGRSHRDLTAIGTVVNTAARAQSVAEAGCILVTGAVCNRAPAETNAGEGRAYELKGFDKPMELCAV